MIPRPNKNTCALLDTMIWMYSTDSKNKFFNTSRKVINCIKGGEFEGWIAPQIGAEIVGAVTNPRRYRPPHQPMDFTKALIFVDSVFFNIPNLQVILPTTTIITKAIEICRTFNLKRKQWYDSVLAATMLDNKVHVLFTMNEDDFKAIPELTIINPFTEDVRFGSIEISIL